MKKRIIINDDYIEILKDGYNIIEKTIYDQTIINQMHNLVKEIEV